MGDPRGFLKVRTRRELAERRLMYRQYINESSVWGGGRPQFLFGPQLLDTYMQDGSRWPSMLGEVI